MLNTFDFDLNLSKLFRKGLERLSKNLNLAIHFLNTSCEINFELLGMFHASFQLIMSVTGILKIAFELIYLKHHFSLMFLHLDNLPLSKLHVTHASFETFIAVTAAAIP